MDECIFCSIIRKESPAEVIFENHRVLAFAAKDPVSPGHTLLIPKAHAENIFDISSEDMAELGRASKEVAQILRATHNAGGINVLHASGKDAQQSVFHFHLHLVPRHENDGLDLWLRQGL